jgi:hypothetical protein
VSIRAIRWVWAHALPSTHKLVLIALADMADDAGHCWPSIKTVAKHCGISTRSVRRILRDLEDQRLLTAELRQREDGSRTSNLYRLGCAGRPNLSEGADAHDRRSGHPYPDGPDVDVTTRSVIGSSIDQPPQRSPVDPVGVVNANTVGLRFPAVMTNTQRQAAAKELSVLSREMAQALLDELRWRMDVGGIRTSPLAYLQGMVRHAMAGTFEAMAPVPSQRDRQVTPRARSYEAEAVSQWERPQAPIYTDVDRNPLCQRAAELEQRARDRRASGEQAIVSGGHTAQGSPTAHSQHEDEQEKPFAFLRAVIGD